MSTPSLAPGFFDASGSSPPPQSSLLLDFSNIYEEIRKAAIDYARQGRKVILLHGVIPRPDGNRICTCWKGAACESHGKHPRLDGWQNLATSNESTIAQWWDKHPQSNVGLLNGGGTLGRVLDVDFAKPEKGKLISGFDFIDQLQEIHGELPITRTIQSGSGSSHFEFQVPPNRIGQPMTGFGGLNTIDANCIQVVAPPNEASLGPPRTTHR